VKAAREICEEAIHPNLVYPEIIFNVWVLMKVEVKELVFIPEGVRMHLD